MLQRGDGPQQLRARSVEMLANMAPWILKYREEARGDAFFRRALASIGESVHRLYVMKPVRYDAGRGHSDDVLRADEQRNHHGKRYANEENDPDENGQGTTDGGCAQGARLDDLIQPRELCLDEWTGFLQAGKCDKQVV